jgi:hypothetical protein
MSVTTGALGRPTGTTYTDPELRALVPTLLVALTEKLYASPLVRPVTIIGFEEPVCTTVSFAFVLFVAVTVYEEGASPPLFHTVNDTTEWASSKRVPETLMGALGALAGVTNPATLALALRTKPFVACTSMLYPLPLRRPPTTIGLVVPVATLG